MVKWNEIVKESKKNKNNPKIWIRPFEGDIKTLVGAWDFIYNHPYAYDRDDQKEWDKLSLRDRWLKSHGQFGEHLSIYIVEKGVGLETGPIYYQDQFPDIVEPQWMTNMHDIRLDTFAPTFEEAVLKLAKKVRKYYGDY